MRGSGPPLLLIHETGTTGAVFADLAERLEPGATVISYDRWGWGGSEHAEPVLRTSVAEQARDAGGLLRARARGPAVVCGAGVGAVIALELCLSWPDLVDGSVLIEPPLFGLLTTTTEGFSLDGERIRKAAEQGGLADAYSLYLSGQLSTIGPGAERIEAWADRSENAPRAFVSELPAVPEWPIEPARLGACERSVRVLTSDSGPEVLNRAADELCGRMPAAERLALPGRGPAHVDAEGLDVLAAELRSLSGA